MTRQIAVIGLGTFGNQLARLLAAREAEVIAIDSDMARVEDIKDSVDAAVCLNANQERALRAQGLGDVDAAVVCIGEDFQSNLLATVLLKKIGVPRVISRASNAIERMILKEVGADDVIIPEEEVAKELATRLTSDSILDLIKVSSNLSAVKLKAPKAFWGKSIKELDVRKKYHINIIAVFKHDLDDFMEDPFPNPDQVIGDGHHLLVVARNEDLEKLEALS